jgi:hypothetical protein
MMDLTFDASTFASLNVQTDLTNLDQECCGGPFHAGGGSAATEADGSFVRVSIVGTARNESAVWNLP